MECVDVLGENSYKVKVDSYTEPEVETMSFRLGIEAHCKVHRALGANGVIGFRK